MKQKNMFIAAAVLIAAAFVAGSFFYKNQQAAQAAQVAAKNQAVLVRADAPSFGNPDAPVHIVEFFVGPDGRASRQDPPVTALRTVSPRLRTRGQGT